MNTCDTTVGGASGEDETAFQVFEDSVERFTKRSRLLPSIVVEPTDGGEVESGELRWPPDDVSSDVREGHAQVTGSSVPVEEAEPQEKVMGGV
ncbi:protein LBH-like isoform X2 [Siniperca chuatsi]|uniref:protein LBH-like isoform X2 n=1 Tax=Siniperca chuatsi TaxID=119488 RepID=UPI001CE1E152|nr:protein LBH-like isoform X2 [Siniperca chuatsi]